MKITSKIKTLFVGIGGAGCKVVEELHKLGYSCLFVDCDIKALNELEVHSAYKYAVKTGDKTNGNRQKGKAYIHKLKEELNEKMLYINANAKYVYFVFGMGGGFGGAIAPRLLSEYTERFSPEHNQASHMLGGSRYFGVIPILPTLKYNELVRMNTAQCYEELYLLQRNIRNYMILDNRYNDIEMIAKSFAELMDRFLSGAEIDRRRLISLSEIEMMMGTKGLVFMGKLQKKDAKYSIKTEEINPFLGTNEKLCSIYCYNVGMDLGDIQHADMNEVCISKAYIFGGYNYSKESYIYIFGRTLPDSIPDVILSPLMSR